MPVAGQLASRELRVFCKIKYVRFFRTHHGTDPMIRYFQISKEGDDR